MALDARIRFHNFRVQLHQLVDQNDALVLELEELANNLDEHFKKISKAKIGGAVGAIVGGILATVGFGLSFVTFGASLGLSIAGGVLAGSGGVVISGSQITDAVLSKNRRISAEIIMRTYRFQVEFLINDAVEIGAFLQNHADIDVNFPLWVTFWGNIAMISASGIRNAGWNVIGRTILNSLRLASYADDVITTGAAVTTTAFKTIGSTTGRALHIAGGVFGILLLPIDIHTFVASSIDVHKSNPHKISRKIREMAATIRERSPAREDIDAMVDEILVNLPLD